MKSGSPKQVTQLAPAAVTPSATRHATWGLLCTLALACSASAQVTTVNFEGLSSMGNSPGSTVPLPARLSNQLVTNFGVIFRSESTNAFVAVVNVGSGTPSPVNAIGGAGGTGVLSYNTPVRISFFLPANPSTPAVTSFVSIKNDSIPLGSGTMTIKAFDAAGVLLAENTQTDNRALTLGVTNAGIHSVRISQTSATIAFDDLSFASALIPADQPRIQIATASGNAVRLEWPSYATNFAPEGADQLPSPAGWVSVTNIPFLEGTNLVVTNLTMKGVQFYRLKKNP